jgi:ATP-binding cassette subfamily G (WHITE) protein 2 (PDR)
MLRQPKHVSKKEKYDYVEEVIKMLNMADFANAVVGVPGEPTSGLDSQVSCPDIA